MSIPEPRKPAFPRGPRSNGGRALSPSSQLLFQKIQEVGLELARGETYPTVKATTEADPTLKEGTVKKYADALDAGRDLWEARHGRNPHRRKNRATQMDPIAYCKFEYHFTMWSVTRFLPERISELERERDRALQERDAAVSFARTQRAHANELSAVLSRVSDHAEFFQDTALPSSTPNAEPTVSETVKADKAIDRSLAHTEETNAMEAQPAGSPGPASSPAGPRAKRGRKAKVVKSSEAQPALPLGF